MVTVRALNLAGNQRQEKGQQQDLGEGVQRREGDGEGGGVTLQALSQSTGTTADSQAGSVQSHGYTARELVRHLEKQSGRHVTQHLRTPSPNTCEPARAECR